MIARARYISTLFHRAPPRFPVSRILHITDSEGSSSFLKSINLSQIVKYHPVHGLLFHRMKEIPYFIFGGDISDRGNHDLFITRLLVEFKSKFPENVFLLAGNREITKTRFKNELSPIFIRQRLLNTQSPRWLDLSHQTIPLDYVLSEMRSNNNNVTDVEEYIAGLSIEECQLLYLRWMLEKTMGCPHTFRYRREELENQRKKTVSDHDVLASFIKESSPEGITGQYLQHAQLAVIVPNTSILAIHGGLTPMNIGRLPNMNAGENKMIKDANHWVNQMNSWYQQQIKAWSEANSSYSTVPANTALDDSALPLLNKPKSIITADMLDEGRRFTPVAEDVSRYLRRNKIKVVLTGHQPVGDFPCILRAGNVLCINGDTGYAGFQGKNTHPDNTRGSALHVLEVSASCDEVHVSIKATLSDNSQVANELSVFADKIEGDDFIGKITPNGELVQCRLTNGNYRLMYQEGHQVTYSVVDSLTLGQQICHPGSPSHLRASAG